MKAQLAKILRGGIFVFLLSFTNVHISQAQCPMCRMTLESNLKNGGTSGQGMNKGIFYLLITPYLLVGSITYMWWRNRKVKSEQDLEEELELI